MAMHWKERADAIESMYDDLHKRLYDTDTLEIKVRDFLKQLLDDGNCDVDGCGCTYSEGITAIRVMALRLRELESANLRK